MLPQMGEIRPFLEGYHEVRIEFRAVTVVRPSMLAFIESFRYQNRFLNEYAKKVILRSIVFL